VTRPDLLAAPWALARALLALAGALLVAIDRMAARTTVAPGRLSWPSPWPPVAFLCDGTTVDGPTPHLGHDWWRWERKAGGVDLVCSRCLRKLWNPWTNRPSRYSLRVECTWGVRDPVTRGALEVRVLDSWTVPGDFDRRPRPCTCPACRTRVRAA
jgi:hypothetical protein